MASFAVVVVRGQAAGNIVRGSRRRTRPGGEPMYLCATYQTSYCNCESDIWPF